MRILVYSQINAAQIAGRLGVPEYSYYFVLRDFLPVLRQLGEVIVVEVPETEVNALYDEALAQGERCIFLSFSPPHKTALGLRCPTIPVFAWEFDSIPNEQWLDEPHQNWGHVLQQCGHAITHSDLTVDAVRQVVGDAFPIIAVPSPVWDRFQSLRSQSAIWSVSTFTQVEVKSGVVLDTHDVALEPYLPGLDAVANAVRAAREREQLETTMTSMQASAEAPFRHQSFWCVTRRYLGEWYLRVVRDQLLRGADSDGVTGSALTIVPEKPQEFMQPTNPVEPQQLPRRGLVTEPPEWKLQPCEINLSGVVFTSLFNPYDGRKNSVDMLTAFCAAFRDIRNVTLVFKLGHHEYQSAMNEMLMCMARMPPFQCRVILVQGYMEGPEFERLVTASTFVVNASHGEGQCLPLMEFLSCGKPAIAPRHSAMLDYIDEQVAFVVDSWLDASAWSHDPRLAYRTCRHQINWASLVDAYRAAYDCAVHDPERYAKMSAAAIERMRNHCSIEVATTRLRAFFHTNDSVCQ